MSDIDAEAKATAYIETLDPFVVAGLAMAASLVDWIDSFSIEQIGVFLTLGEPPHQAIFYQRYDDFVEASNEKRREIQGLSTQ